MWGKMPLQSREPRLPRGPRGGKRATKSVQDSTWWANPPEEVLRFLTRTQRIRGKGTLAERKLLREIGVRGSLASLLNDGDIPIPLRGLGGGGMMLREGFLRGGGWKGLQFDLLWRHHSRKDASYWFEWAVALHESLVFERVGFTIRECIHGKHWFLSDDPRRKYCPPHQRAGWQAEYRRKHKRD